MHKANVTRKYYDINNKLVATNRHKAIEQKADSLEEYRAAHGEKAVSQLTVKSHLPAYKDANRITPNTQYFIGGDILLYCLILFITSVVIPLALAMGI